MPTTVDLMSDETELRSTEQSLKTYQTTHFSSNKREDEHYHYLCEKNILGKQWPHSAHPIITYKSFFFELSYQQTNLSVSDKTRSVSKVVTGLAGSDLTDIIVKTISKILLRYQYSKTDTRQ